MPQSTNVTANQMRNIPEQAAEAAATDHGKQTHLSAHEETVRAAESAHETDPQAGHNTVHDSALHHGKAAAEAAKK